MFRFITFFLILLFAAIPELRAQDEEFDKLQQLYVDRKYEACIRKAERYIRNDKYRKEPLPYLYASKCYYEFAISEDPDIQDYYRNALKDAIKNAAKFMSKDKDNIYYEYHEDYLNRLTRTYLEITKAEYNEEDYRKAASNYKQLLKIREDDYLKFTKGVCEAMSNNRSVASDNISEALNNLLSDVALVIIPESKEFALEAAIDYSDYLLKVQQPDSALSTINIFMKVLPANQQLKIQHQKVKEAISKLSEEN